MNVLHIIPYYAPAWAYGGVVRAATDLTRALVAEGHNVYVLTTDTLSPTERTIRPREAIAGVHVYRVRNWSNTLRGKLNLSSPVRMRSAVRYLLGEHAIDVVHCHEVRTVENLRALPVAKDLGVPVVVSPHGTLPLGTGRGSIKRLWDMGLGRRMLPRFDHVIALTAHEAADARTIWCARGLTLTDSQVSVVPNGVNVNEFTRLPTGEAFRVRWKLGQGPVVLFLGRLHERKGLQLLIPAFGEVVKQAPDARLLMVGPDEGMLTTLAAQVAARNLAERVIFTGMLTGDDKRAALAVADVFVLPAVGEGFSMAVLEAMACSLPVVLTPGCHFPEVIEAGAGYVVERCVPALSAVLHDLVIDSAKRQRMGHAARILVRRQFSWPHIVRRLETVYQQVIEQKSPGR